MSLFLCVCVLVSCVLGLGLSMRPGVSAAQIHKQHMSTKPTVSHALSHLHTNTYSFPQAAQQEAQASAAALKSLRAESETARQAACEQQARLERQLGDMRQQLASAATDAHLKVYVCVWLRLREGVVDV